MKKTYFWSFISVLLTVSLVTSASGAWYSNGSLHKVSIKQWNQASNSNKLATAADWALTCPEIKKKVKKSGSIDTLKPFAAILVNCLKEATAGKGYDNMSAAEMAAACMVLMGWTK